MVFFEAFKSRLFKLRANEVDQVGIVDVVRLKFIIIDSGGESIESWNLLQEIFLGAGKNLGER